MKKYSNVLSQELAKTLYDFALSIVQDTQEYPQENLLVWTNYAWDEGIVRDSAPVLCIRMPKNLAEKFQVELQDIGIFNPITDKPLYTHAMLYVWFKNSYIPNHSDSNLSKAVTVYLNQTWDYNEGGLFQWLDQETDEWKTIFPSFNTAVVNTLGLPHSVTPVKSDKQFRITAQTFIRPL